MGGEPDIQDGKGCYKPAKETGGFRKETDNPGAIGKCPMAVGDRGEV